MPLQKASPTNTGRVGTSPATALAKSVLPVPGGPTNLKRDQRFHGGNHRKPQQPKIGYVPTHEAHTKLLKEKFREISSFSGKKTTAKNPWHVWVVLGDLSNFKSLPFGVAATKITRIQPYEFFPRVWASWNGYVFTGWYRLHNSHHQINDHRTCRGKTSFFWSSLDVA